MQPMGVHNLALAQDLELHTTDPITFIISW